MPGGMNPQISSNQKICRFFFLGFPDLFLCFLLGKYILPHTIHVMVYLAT